MIFLDYDVRTFLIRSGSSQTYTIPYKCMVVVGFVRPDDDDFPLIRLRSFGGIGGENADGVDHYLMTDRGTATTYVGSNTGSVIAKSGDVLTLDGDEVDIEMHFFRLPESE